ncbi:MAG: divergent PAP2 family protein [Lentisphaerae bacterium]|nr:divergent PAP2 family protein [Lentisphaerota bacterium]
MNGSIMALFHSEIFWAAFCAWIAAQCTKMAVGWYERGRLDFSYLVSTGGMPSAHSSLVCGLATAVGLKAGFGEPVSVLAIAFAAVTMFDATTVRYAAGQQARLLNEIVDELFQEHHLSERKLAELLGHTPLQVFMGLVMGVLTALLVHAAAWRF